MSGALRRELREVKEQIVDVDDDEVVGVGGVVKVEKVNG